MENSKINQQQVVQANRKFYDAVALHYEEIDGRRTQELENWLRENLKGIRNRCPGTKLLDIGTGSGFVTRCARGLFEVRVGLDISPVILGANREFFDYAVAAEVSQLPFASASFDAVTCFAVLHHLYNFEGLVAEIKRVLKPGGVFYSDHDMDKRFSERFVFFLFLYKKLHSCEAKYAKVNCTITPELYALTEWQEKGVDSAHIVNLFKANGFSVVPRFHWFGLSRVTNVVFSKRCYSQGIAPLVSFRAVKN